MNGTECRPQAPVAEGGPVGFFDGGNRRDWFPGVRGSEGGFRPLKVRCQTHSCVCIRIVSLELRHTSYQQFWDSHLS